MFTFKELPCPPCKTVCHKEEQGHYAAFCHNSKTAVTKVECMLYVILLTRFQLQLKKVVSFAKLHDFVVKHRDLVLDYAVASELARREGWNPTYQGE